MIRDFAEDYSNYLLATNVKHEIEPICTNIDDVLCRLGELETMLMLVRSDSTATQSLRAVEELAREFAVLRERIDSMERVIGVVNQNLARMEKHVEVAAEELGFNRTGLRGLLQPLFKDIRKSANTPAASNLDAAGNYAPEPIYSTEDYFPDSTSC